MLKNTFNTTLDDIIRIAENDEWDVYIGDSMDGHYIEFSKFTDMGQDFSFTVEYCDDIEMLAKNVYKYWLDFDVDEEASIWIGDDGHGKNGAPYRISDILKDMEQAKQMIFNLYHLLNKC